MEVKESLPASALTTDVIVGFPGETEADFEASCRRVEQVGFSKVHVFRFSPAGHPAKPRCPTRSIRLSDSAGHPT